MPQNRNKELAILQKIKQHVDERKEICLIRGCNEIAINSHLLQKNGILDQIAENRHLIQLKLNDLFKVEKDGYVKFRKVGIEQSISYPLYCNFHDASVFKAIESHPLILNNYRSQLLFSYRATCAELGKKQKNVELYTRILNSKKLAETLDRVFFDRIEIQRKGNELGVNDLTVFKQEFEKEMDISDNRFTFQTHEFPFTKVSVSAIFSHTKLKSRDRVFNKLPLNTLFVNVFPYNGKLSLIVGYHNNYVDDWIQEYIKKWASSTSQDFSHMLTDLTIRVESWVMAESLFESVPKKLWETYKRNFLEAIRTGDSRYFFTPDIFRVSSF